MVSDQFNLKIRWEILLRGQFLLAQIIFEPWSLFQGVQLTLKVFRLYCINKFTSSTRTRQSRCWWNILASSKLILNATWKSWHQGPSAGPSPDQRWSTIPSGTLLNCKCSSYPSNQSAPEWRHCHQCSTWTGWIISITDCFLSAIIDCSTLCSDLFTSSEPTLPCSVFSWPVLGAQKSLSLVVSPELICFQFG